MQARIRPIVSGRVEEEKRGLLAFIFYLEADRTFEQDTPLTSVQLQVPLFHMMSLKKKVALFGATGNTGREFVPAALSAGYEVRALLRTNVCASHRNSTFEIATHTHTQFQFKRIYRYVLSHLLSTLH